MARSVSFQASLESIGNYPEAETLANKPEKQGVRHIRGVGSGNFSDTTSAISSVRALVECIAPSIAPNFYTESRESVMDELSAVFVRAEPCERQTGRLSRNPPYHRWIETAVFSTRDMFTKHVTKVVRITPVFRTTDLVLRPRDMLWTAHRACKDRPQSSAGSCREIIPHSAIKS